MSLAYYIVLDNEEPGFDTFVNGKYLAREDGLDALCKQLHLKAFGDFLAMSEDDISDMLGEDIDLPEGEGERWFAPEEGLAWAPALAAHIKADPPSVTERSSDLAAASKPSPNTRRSWKRPRVSAPSGI